ncbi:Pre-rRNA-processing protein ipi3 [Neophaeococcomyces mojaviensis]|uniref:Pre-rRNA-processing protein ipi3 n=1 Tax=Neophaeococcomyces mojaviensis TaxID=3383035 RepID=A0ACC2ZUA5_9EURO|nr:Pre-rRNA-processing protein ipi3 [Knufia sp. JES_112]
MLVESFVAATEIVKPAATHLSSALKDVGIYLHEFQPQSILRQGFKKSSVAKNCLAVSDTHVFAAQAGKAVVNVYSREKCNQEATVPFPQKISSLACAQQAAVLIIGTQDGKLMLWELATGRVSTSTASHIEPVTILVVVSDGEHVISASPDSVIHIWSLRSLLTISKPQNTFSNSSSDSRKEPVATFTQHRSAIQALAVGHSQDFSTNIVVSASEDKTCYIWSLSSLSILRTIVLLETPQCAIFDPVERSVYVGSIDGSVQSINVLAFHSNSSILDSSARTASTPFQLPSEGKWSPPSASNLGAAYCITLSYDGTALITGHASGTLLRWDVAKHRVVSEITNLSSQSATNLQMLRPTGFANTYQGGMFVVPTITKPRLDLTNPSSTSATSSIPVDYTLNIQVTQAALNLTPSSKVITALHSHAFPSSLLDEAIQSLTHKHTSSTFDDAGSASNTDLHQTEVLQEELMKLRSQVAAHLKQDQQRLERHIERVKRREAVGIKKREAFFKAKKDGKNGDEAMKSFEQIEQEIDNETDGEWTAEDVSGRDGEDIEMGT